MIFQPLFSNTTVAAERSVIIQELTQRSSGKEFSHWILKRLFPLHSFLSRSVCGSVSSIKRINRSKLIAFHDTYYSLANTALIVAGHVSHDDVIDKVSTYDSRCHSVTPFLPWIHPEIGMWKFKENNSSSALDLHFPGISSQRDSIIANVVFRMLVFPPFGFLHQKLRQERGIIYGLSGNTGEFPKSINIWNIPSDVQWHDEIIKIITETLHEFVRNEYDQKYFEYQRTFERMRLAERAEKKRKTFSYPDNLSDSWLRQDFDFEEERYLHEMTRDDLTDVARRFFNPSTMGVVRIVPKKKK